MYTLARLLLTYTLTRIAICIYTNMYNLTVGSLSFSSAVLVLPAARARARALCPLFVFVSTLLCT